MSDSNSTGNVMMLCPNLKCRKLLRVPEYCRGKQVRCQYCNITFKVPDAEQKQHVQESGS